VLGSGEVWRVEETEDGKDCAKVVSGCLVGGKPEAEVSWCVEGAFKIEVSPMKLNLFDLFIASSQYLVRVFIKPPEDMCFLGSSLPTFFHQEIVRMATHEYTSNELVRGHPCLALMPRAIW
jgi:hypothetical protein